MPITSENDITRLFSEFAGKNIATRPGLSRSAAFPTDLWDKMAEAGLLGVGIDSVYGGLGGGAAQIQAAGSELVSKGRCLGFALSWLIHCAAGRYVIGRLGSAEQKELLMPLMAAGKMTASVAMSEPGVGAHPKHLSTRAVEVPGGYEISGEKAYLTNGPIAGLFIVAAVSGETNGKKQFSAFLVPREADGLAVKEAMPLEMLRPAPHCGISLDRVRVPSESLLGEKGDAWQAMVKPFRTIEDVLLMGPVIGGLYALAEGLASFVRESSPQDYGKTGEDFGRYFSMIQALSAVAKKAADLLDNKGDENALDGLCVAFRSISGDIYSLLEKIRSETGALYDEILQILASDMAASAKIAARVAALKQKNLGGLFLSQA